MNLHNELKSYLPRKIFEIYYSMYIRKRVGKSSNAFGGLPRKIFEIYYSMYIRKRVGKSSNAFGGLLIYWYTNIWFLICLLKLPSITLS